MMAPATGPAHANRRGSRPRSWRPGVSASFRTLPLLISLFALAGVIRLGIGLGAAMAGGDGAPAPTREPAPAAGDVAPGQGGATETAPPAAGAEAAGADAGDVAAMLIDLQERESALQARSETLEERLALLAAAEARLQAQIASLQAAESALDDMMTRADRIAAEDLAQLVAVYEAMRPEQAAQVFAEMEPSFAAGFLAQLRPATAAGILAGLEPSLAYALSATLAGRNAAVPRRADAGDVPAEPR